MTMVSSGPISLGGTATSGGLNQSINVELGFSGTAQISLNDAAVRTLLQKASGAISLNDAYGKSNTFSFTISTNQTNANLRTLAVNAGWNQSSAVEATISGGVYCSSNSTGTPGLTINGSFPGGVSLVNNGFIIGMGGAGGAGGGYTSNVVAGAAGAAGGLALSVSVAVSITNNGTIGGGGGGGGGGRGGQLVISGKDTQTYSVGGGGGGGGRTGTASNSSGGSGGPATGGSHGNSPGSAGGSGTSSAAGGGGSGGTSYLAVGGAGGAGGGWGSSGSSGGSGSNISTTGGGPYSGGSAGGAVSGNSNVTWVATGTRLGSIT